MNRTLTILLFLCLSASAATAQAKLELADAFNLAYISHPSISPDGQQVVYVHNAMDIMADKGYSNIWMANYDGSGQRPLTQGMHTHTAPQWSPDGKRLLYTASKGSGAQLYLRWMDSGAEAQLTHTQKTPSNAQWSPDGKWIAFTMAVPATATRAPIAKMPAPPKGAKWAEAPKVIEKMTYRADGGGYIEDTYTHLFVIPSTGGYPRQLTQGDYHHRGGFCWSADGQAIILSADRRPQADEEAGDNELYELRLSDGALKPLTDRRGRDISPSASPDGQWIAYLGSDERYLGYQANELYLLPTKGGTPRRLLAQLDREVEDIQWSADSKNIYFLYDTEGHTRLAQVSLADKMTDLANEVGGLSLGRPYSGGQFSVAANGRYAFTLTSPAHPADLAVGAPKEAPRRLTQVNEGLFAHKKPAEVEEIWYKSSHDGKPIQGWICKPPGFDPAQQYPLLLEIHGGPFTNYGWRYSAEVQLFAAAGYVVLYTNPRGSTSYGHDFANLIHHNYPSQDYDDLISGVDEVISRGYIDPQRLYVTGGSGGGVLTAWIVGKTDRFKAAVVAKPVINWTSFVLHADNPAFFYRYWFPAKPWEAPDHYFQRSPLSLVGNVKTPTMLLTGEQDYRTPMSETEQYYAALKINKVPTAMVRIQEAGHGIANRPSNLMNKVGYILGWFEQYP